MSSRPTPRRINGVMMATVPDGTYRIMGSMWPESSLSTPWVVIHTLDDTTLQAVASSGMAQPNPHTCYEFTVIKRTASDWYTLEITTMHHFGSMTNISAPLWTAATTLINDPRVREFFEPTDSAESETPMPFGSASAPPPLPSGSTAVVSDTTQSPDDPSWCEEHFQMKSVCIAEGKDCVEPSATQPLNDA